MATERDPASTSQSTHPSFTAGAIRHVHVSCWLALGGADDVAQLRQLLLAQAEEHGQIECCFVVAKLYTRGKDLAQAHMAAMVRELGERLRRSVVVIEGDGFWASAIRGLVTGVAMMAGNTNRHTIVAERSAARDILFPAESYDEAVRAEFSDLVDRLSGQLIVKAASA